MSKAPYEHHFKEYDYLGLKLKKRAKVEDRQVTIFFTHGPEEVSDTLTLSTPPTKISDLLLFNIQDQHQIDELNKRLLSNLWDNHLANFARQTHHQYIAKQEPEDSQDTTSASVDWRYDFHDKCWLIRVGKSNCALEQNVSADAPTQERHIPDFTPLHRVEQQLKAELVERGYLHYPIVNRMETDSKYIGTAHDWEEVYQEDRTLKTQDAAKLHIDYSETLKKYRLKLTQGKHQVSLLFKAYARRDVPNEFAGDDVHEIVEYGCYYAEKQLLKNIQKPKKSLRNFFGLRP